MCPSVCRQVRWHHECTIDTRPAKSGFVQVGKHHGISQRLFNRQNDCTLRRLDHRVRRNHRRLTSNGPIEIAPERSLGTDNPGCSGAVPIGIYRLRGVILKTACKRLTMSALACLRHLIPQSASPHMSEL